MVDIETGIKSLQNHPATTSTIKSVLQVRRTHHSHPKLRPSK